MALSVDLDFQRYIERRKGALEAQAREGAAYAYGGDLRIKKTLDSLKPVQLAVDATVRLWKSVARKELLDGATKVTPESNAKLEALIEQAAKTLHIPRPMLYVAPALGETYPFWAYTFGTDEDAYIVLNGARMGSLTDSELLFVLGCQCGHIQNNHVVLTTSLYYLTRAANRFVKWIVTPAAAALSAWSRRADITCDRAGLICAKNVDTAEAVMLKIAEANESYAQKRVLALRVFVESAYYKALTGGTGGLTQAEVDGKVGEVLAT